MPPSTIKDSCGFSGSTQIIWDYLPILRSSDCNLNWICNLNFLLPHKVAHSQVPGIWKWTSLSDHYSAHYIQFFSPHVVKTLLFKSLWDLFWGSVCHNYRPTFFCCTLFTFLCSADNAFFFFFNNIEGLWQSCIDQVSWYHFSNSSCSLHVSVSQFGTFWKISNFFIIIILLQWAVISGLWCYYYNLVKGQIMTAFFSNNFFFPFSFLATLWHMEFPGQEAELSHSYVLHHSYGDAGSLTHCAGSQINQTSIPGLQRCRQNCCATVGTLKNNL